MTLAKFNFSDAESKPSGWLAPFREYIESITIDSKETGVGPLKPYKSQLLYLQQIAKGLDEGCHSFTVLKARQLGISTIQMPINTFWASLYPGTKGTIVVDEEGNREQFRQIIERTLSSLPKNKRISIKKHNREALEFENGSTLRYLVAGTRKKGALGVGGGYSFVHATECSRYGDPEAWASFKAALAEQNPNRLFIYESTARGFNLFRDMWLDAIDAPDQRAIFIGWWAKETYRLKKGTQLYNHHWDGTYTDEELDNIEEVKKLYGVEIDSEQVAWYRYTTKRLGTAGEFVTQEHPWTAEQAFLASGKWFFPTKLLTSAMHRASRSPTSDGVGYKAYRYHLGNTFSETRLENINDYRRIKQVTLRIFEEPDPHGIYAIGADPAYGDSIEGNVWRDRFSIQVLRCYADKVVQVAEYADDDLAPHQFAWVLAHLAGAYRNTKVCLEINGPGVAVHLALNHLKEQVIHFTQEQKRAAPNIDKLFESWSWYLYRRIDSLGGGFMLHFKSDSQKKNDLMLRMKDAFMLGQLELNSVPLIEEMQDIVSKEGWVGAEGRGKDDRCLAFALAYRCYDEMIRKQMISENKTFEQETRAQEAREATSKVPDMTGMIVKNFFTAAEQARLESETIDQQMVG